MQFSHMRYREASYTGNIEPKHDEYVKGTISLDSLRSALGDVEISKQHEYTSIKSLPLSKPGAS